ncbi:hypothetical protein PTKIN_Ptkin18bG0060000 [Pterospermum kingtungense]
MQHETLPISISRVNQFDAARLDIEVSAMLKEQLVKVFSLTKPGMLFQYEPELDAFLEFLIWRFSIWVDKPTPGNALMNLRYRDERAMETGVKVRTGLEGPGLTVAQKMWYCIAMIGGQYIWARLQSFSAFRRWGDSEQRPLARRAWGLLQHVEGLYKAASFGNLLLFLYTGGRCYCCFCRFLTCQLLKVFSTPSQRTNLQVLQRMTLLVPFAGQVQHFLILLSLVSIGIATTALGQDVVRLHHSSVQDAVSLLWRCSGMGVLLSIKLTVSNFFIEVNSKRKFCITKMPDADAAYKSFEKMKPHSI